MKKKIALPLIVLAACSSSDPLVPAPEVTAVEQVVTRFASIEVLEVSLPEYASESEIYVERDGTLIGAGTLWADDPARAVTLALSRNLTQITGARIAPEPWPFDAYPEARVDVRIERLLADENGSLVMSGQVFVADLTGSAHDHARLFHLEHPIGGDFLPSAAARARSSIVAELAVFIAREGLH